MAFVNSHSDAAHTMVPPIGLGFGLNPHQARFCKANNACPVMIVPLGPGKFHSVTIMDSKELPAESWSPNCSTTKCYYDTDSWRGFVEAVKAGAYSVDEVLDKGFVNRVLPGTAGPTVALKRLDHKSQLPERFAWAFDGEPQAQEKKERFWKELGEAPWIAMGTQMRSQPKTLFPTAQLVFTQEEWHFFLTLVMRGDCDPEEGQAITWTCSRPKAGSEPGRVLATV